MASEAPKRRRRTRQKRGREMRQERYGLGTMGFASLLQFFFSFGSTDNLSSY